MTIEERVEWEHALYWYNANLEREAKRYQYRTGPRYGQQLADARKAVSR